MPPELTGQRQGSIAGITCGRTPLRLRKLMAQYLLDHPAIALQMLDRTPSGGELGAGQVESASNRDDAFGQNLG